MLRSLRRVVVASASPRRRGFLHQLGYHFEVVTPATEEKVRPGEGAAEYVLRNAQEKALLLARAAAQGDGGADAALLPE